MSAAATRDDLLSVVTALTDEAAHQQVIENDYNAKSDAESVLDLKYMWQKFAYEARGMRVAYEIGADMISKYVSVGPEYTRVVNGETT